MKRSHTSLLIIILSLVLFSCTREAFSTSSMILRESEDGAILSLIIESKETADYSFILTSPDGDLSWEGKLSKRGGRFESDTLLITPGASFPRGEYSLIINSTLGSAYTSSVRY